VNELHKISAERDALLKALRLAEEGIAAARTAQRSADARSHQLHTELQALRARPLAPAAEVSHGVLTQALDARQRAEIRVQHVEAQLRGQQMECEALQGAIEELKTENEHLQAGMQILQSQYDEAQADREALQVEAEETRTELDRLRAVLLRTTTGVEIPETLLPPSAQTPPKRADSEASYGYRPPYQRSSGR